MDTSNKNRLPANGKRWTTAELKEILKFPIVGYRKENGFLGIISKDKGKVHFFSKSTDEGDYVNWFIGVLCDNYNIKASDESYSKIYNLVQQAEPKIIGCLDQSIINTHIALKNDLLVAREQLQEKLGSILQEGYSYVFECIDKDNDPHIIKYNENRVILLEVFKNQLKEEHVSWKELHEIADRLVVPCKSQELRFNNWEEFEEWKHKFRQGVTQWDCKHEGYVFEDANGFRVKFKSSFYQFWKQMRSIKQSLQKGGNNKKIYKTKEEIQAVKIMESIPKDKLKEMSIIDVEDMFYEQYEGV